MKIPGRSPWFLGGMLALGLAGLHLFSEPKALPVALPSEGTSDDRASNDGSPAKKSSEAEDVAAEGDTVEGREVPLCPAGSLPDAGVCVPAPSRSAPKAPLADSPTGL